MTTTTNPYTPQAAPNPDMYAVYEPPAEFPPPAKEERDAVLAEIWELAETGANTTRLLDLIAASWTDADQAFARIDMYRSAQADSIVSLDARHAEMKIEVARAVSDGAHEETARSHLEALIDSWGTAASRVKTTPSSSIAARLIRAVRDRKLIS